VFVVFGVGGWSFFCLFACACVARGVAVITAASVWFFCSVHSVAGGAVVGVFRLVT
jgi:hypothetical protein